VLIRALKAVDGVIAVVEGAIALVSITAILALVSWQVPVRLMSVESRKGFAASLGGVGEALFGDYTWMTPLARFLLLWATFAGASLATRTRRHILIDAVTKSLPSKRVQAIVNVPSTLLAALLTGFLAWVAVGFVHENWNDQTTLRGLNLGLVQLVIPFALGVMSFRFVITALEDGRGAITGDLAYLAAFEAHTGPSALAQSGERAPTLDADAPPDAAASPADGAPTGDAPKGGAS